MSGRSGALNVFLNSRLVGQYSQAANGATGFQYDRAYLDWPHALPVSLSLPLQEAAYTGAPVFAVFENLLPDNMPIRNRVAARVRAGGADAYNLLAAIGRDCVGALQFLPDDEDPGPAGAVEGVAVSEAEMARILGDLATAPLGLGADDDFRISIAGAQEKTALLYRQGQWFKPLGATATTHILKPQIGRLPNGIDLSCSVENEFLCLRLCSAFGLPSAQADIIRIGGRNVLAVERFDRMWTEGGRLLRRPQEDLCQALSVPPVLKYESDGGPGIPKILHLLRGSDDAVADRAQFMKAVIVFWLLGATDGHAKNFSLHLASGGRFRLTPLYDVISTQPSADTGQVQRNRMKLAMAAGTRRHYQVDSIMPRHFVQSAALAGVGSSVVRAVMRDLHETIPAAMAQVFADLPADYPAGLADSIGNGVHARLNRVADFLRG